MNKFFKNVILILPVLFLAFNFTNVKADTIVYDSSIKQDGLHHYDCEINTNTNSGITCASVITTFTYGLDKSSYVIGDTVHASINVINSSYTNSNLNTSGVLHPYLIPKMNNSDQYRIGTGFYPNQSTSSTCSSLTFLQAGVNCTTSFVIPANSTSQQLYPYVNHGPPYSSSEYYTVTTPTAYGNYGVYIQPIIGFGSQDPQFGTCYSFNSSGSVYTPGISEALCYVSISMTYNIPNPSTPPQIFVK